MTASPRYVVLAAALAAPACMNMDHGALPAAAPMIQPQPWAGSLSAPVAVDENPDPAIVEITLVAQPGEVEYQPGKRAQAWTYNGTVPGPTIEARPGDRVIVHFQNALPEETTIHWHGLRIANAMDGTPRVMQPVAAGGSFEYDFVVPDAGTFWYHPHIRSDVQVEKGLYGAIVVRDPAEPALDIAAEEILVLDDVRVNAETGAVEDVVDARAEMMGREGNLALVNGVRSNLGVDVRAGERRRWRIVNAANSRYFKLTLAGGELVRIGGDGGLLEAPVTVGELLLTPGERVDLLVSVPAAGGTATLRAVPYERATGAGATEALDLVRLVASADTPVVPAALPASLRAIEPVDASVTTRTITLGERMEGDRMLFTINDAVFPDVPVLDAALATAETWEIVNDTEMDHPFHLHGFRFQQDGAALPEWKDTINVPGGATVRLLADFAGGPDAAGGWMYHCHILEHAEGGMMGEVLVGP